MLRSQAAIEEQAVNIEHFGLLDLFTLRGAGLRMFVSKFYIYYLYLNPALAISIESVICCSKNILEYEGFSIDKLTR